MKVKIKIELGNDLMLNGYDVDLALTNVGQKIRRHYGHSEIIMPFDGKIQDGNGQTVGTWEVSE